MSPKSARGECNNPHLCTSSLLPSQGIKNRHRLIAGMGRTPAIPLFTLAIPAAFIIALVIVAGCSGTAPASPAVTTAPVPHDQGSGQLWKETVLTDLQGRGNFSIGAFAGRTVIVRVVSDSCPTCIVQLQREIGEIDGLAQGNPGIVVVSLDIDPDTGPGFMAGYGGADFSGYSARSPPELTLGLLHRFGPFAIDPETIPVILVCPGGKELLLPPGIKTGGSLNETIAREC